MQQLGIKKRRFIKWIERESGRSHVETGSSMARQFPPGRISAFSGVEREDEVYSARQLAARDSEEAVKPEEKPADTSDVVQLPPLQATTKLRVRVQVNSKKLEDTALEGNQQQLSLPATRSKPATTGSSNRAKPLTVTSSIFRAADNKAKKEPVQLQDGSRKDNTFPRPVQSTEKSFVGVQALKESLEESLKENNGPKRKQRCRQQSVASRAPFVFQVSYEEGEYSEAVKQLNFGRIGSRRGLQW